MLISTPFHFPRNPYVTTKNNPSNASRPQHYCNAADEQVLCRLEEIADGGSKEIVLRDTSDFSLCLVRQEENVYAYRNSCPHTGCPLNWVGGQIPEPGRRDDSMRITRRIVPYHRRPVYLGALSP